MLTLSVLCNLLFDRGQTCVESLSLPFERLWYIILNHLWLIGLLFFISCFPSGSCLIVLLKKIWIPLAKLCFNFVIIRWIKPNLWNLLYSLLKWLVYLTSRALAIFFSQLDLVTVEFKSIWLFFSQKTRRTWVKIGTSMTFFCHLTL